MKDRTIRTLLILLLLLSAAGLACGLGNPLAKSEALVTAAALAPTVESGLTALAATVQIAATEFAPQLEGAATQIAPAVEAVATEAAAMAATVMASPPAIDPTLAAIATEVAAMVQSLAAGTPVAPVATPAGGIQEFLSLSQASEGLSGLDSFRQTGVADFVRGEETGRIDYWGELTADPRAAHGSVTLSGLAAAGLPLPTFEYLVIDDEAWIKVGRQPWLPVQGGVETSTGHQPYSADDFLLVAPNAQRVLPDQTVNAIPSKHYVYTVTEVQLENGTLHTATGDIFAALDGGYVVQYTLRGQATLDQFGGQTGVINLTYNVFDVNSGISIEPPR